MADKKKIEEELRHALGSYSNVRGHRRQCAHSVRHAHSGSGVKGSITEPLDLPQKNGFNPGAGRAGVCLRNRKAAANAVKQRFLLQKDADTLVKQAEGRGC